MTKTVIVYIAAAVAEIAGCFSFWMWSHESKPVWWLASQRNRLCSYFVAISIALFSADQARAANNDTSDYIFVAARSRAEIAVIDTKTDALVGRISLPGIPREVVAFDKGSRLVVAASAANEVWLVNVVTGRVERSLAVPMPPRLLQVSRAGDKIVVLDPEAGKAVLLLTNADATPPMPDFEGAHYAVFQPDGKLLIAHGSRVAIVNTIGHVIAELAVDSADGPITHIALDLGGDYVFVAQGDRGVLSIFDLRTKARRAVLRLPAPLGRVVPSEDSQFILVPVGRHAISVISAWTLRESRRFEVDGDTESIGLTLLQSVAAITTTESRRLLLYDLHEHRRLSDLPLPDVPKFGAASPDGFKYYLALPHTGQIATVEVSHRPTLHLIDDVGIGAWAVVPAQGSANCH